MTLIQNGSTPTITFLMVATSDHIAGLTGITPTVNISKAGGAGAASTNAASAVDATNLPGVYKVALTATETNTNGELTFHATGTGADPSDWKEQVVAFNPTDAVRLGLTALPNAAAEAAGGLYTRGAGAGQINQNASGQVDTRTVTMATDVITAAAIQADAIGAAEIANGAIDAATFAAGAIDASAIATDAIGSAELAATAVAEIAAAILSTPANLLVTDASGRVTMAGTAAGAITSSSFAAGAIDASAIATDAIGSAELAASAVTEIQSGLATSASITTLQADTDDIQTRLPAALVSGRMDSSTGAMAAGVVTAAAVATNAIDADALAADAVTEIAAGVSVGSAPTAAQNAAAVWDLAISGHTTSGTFGAKVNGLSGASGSGAIAHTFTVTAPGAIDGALVWVTTDAAGTNTIASAVTDALGHATVFLDAGTYYAWAQRGGINFIEGGSFVVA